MRSSSSGKTGLIDDLDERDVELLGTLLAEEQISSLAYDSELASEQAEAMRRYLGQPYSGALADKPGRSTVVSRETFETVQWMQPELRRMFTGGRTMFQLDSQNALEDEYAQDAADYMNRLFFTENRGRKHLREYVFSGLLQKIAFIGVHYRDGEWSDPQHHTNLNMQELELFADDPEIEFDGEPEAQAAADPLLFPDGVSYSVVIRRKLPGKYEIVVHPPENVRISPQASDVDGNRAFGFDIPMMVRDVIDQFPEHRDAIIAAAPYADLTADDLEDARRQERFATEDTLSGEVEESASELTKSVTLKEDYIYHDYDEDGIAELRQVYRLGSAILHNEEIDENPYAAWSPYPIAHKLIGQGVYDVVGDTEKVKTATTRYALDGMNAAVHPRVNVDSSRVNMADVLMSGGPIRIKGPVGGAVEPWTVPDVSGSALQMMETFDRIAERRTGVRRRGQAMNPDALHDTARGQNILENADSVIKEEIGANLQEGLELFAGKFYRLICRTHTKARTVRLNGREVQIDPRNWRYDMGVEVKTGLGTGAKEQRLLSLNMIQTDQEKIIGALGQQNPIVTVQHLLNTIEEKTRVIGFDTEGQFFERPPENWQPETPPNPEAEKAKAEAAAKQQQAQLDAQIEQQKMQAKAQADQAELAMKERIAMREAELKHTLEMEKIQQRDAQLQAEFDLKMKMFREELAMKERVAIETAHIGAAARASTSVGVEVEAGGDSV